MATKLEPPLLGGRLLAEWVVIAALVVTLVVTVLAVRSSLTDDRATDSRSATTSPADPRPIALQGASAAPGAPRVQVMIAPETSGDVRVTEVVNTSSPVASLDLALPPAASSGGLAASPRVADLQVTVGDVTVPAAFPATSRRTTLDLPAPGAEVRLTYLMSGATVQHRGPDDRRALVQVRPLSYGVGAGDGLVTTRVTGVVVHNLVCPELPVEEQLCGREADGVWRTTDVPADSSTVLAQVDLPQG